MHRRRLYLIVAVALAAGWTAWLGYEARTKADPIVISRPQILVAPVIVEAELDDSIENPRSAQVIKVYRGQELLGLPPEAREPKNLKILVRDVEAAKAHAYILALRETAVPGEFEVVPTPSSPGYPSGAQGRNAPIYTATESTRMQVREVLQRFQRALGPD